MVLKCVQPKWYLSAKTSYSKNYRPPNKIGGLGLDLDLWARILTFEAGFQNYGAKPGSELVFTGILDGSAFLDELDRLRTLAPDGNLAESDRRTRIRCPFQVDLRHVVVAVGGAGHQRWVRFWKEFFCSFCAQ